MIAAALTVLGLGISTVVAGSMKMKGLDVPITPASHPFRFWSFVAFTFVWSSAVLYVAVRDIKALRRRANWKRSRKREAKSE